MKTKPFRIPIIAMTAFMLNSHNNIEAQNTGTNGTYSNIEFKIDKIKEPIIPNNTVNIKDYGAVNGGTALNTKTFSDAIDAVSKKGGGKVIIPPGIWLAGPIILKSNIELHAEKGALIKFSTNKDLYPIIQTSFEGLNTWRCISPIYGKNLENIAFTGKGVWDGSGEVWRFVKKSNLTEVKAEKGFSIIDANGIKLSNIKLDLTDSTVFEINNGKNMSCKDIEFNSKSPKAVIIKGAVCKNIELISSTAVDFYKKLLLKLLFQMEQ